MSHDTADYDLGAIHELLLAAFTAEDLRRFCLEDPRFRPIYNRFGPNHGFDDMVDEVVDFCRTHSLWPEFLAAVQQARPKTYAQFAPRLGAVAPSAYIPLPPPDPDQLAEHGPLPPGSRLPFERNHLFTGREAQLKALAKALLHDDAGSTLITQAVHGMGGIGKTQLAVEFAYRYGRFFHGVHWLHCAQPDAIAAEIAACGGEMALSPWPQDQPGQVDLTVQAWGQDGHRHLVILDNLEDVDAAREWLRRLRGSRAALLLTARRQRWPRDLGLEPLQLRTFTPEESLDFLRRTLLGDRATRADLERLARRLGHLPLALELAGRYLDGSPLPVPVYLEKLDKVLSHKSMAGWAEELGNPTGHDLDLLRTFALSWEQLAGETEAQRLFAVAGYCAANHPIPCELLASAASLDEEACAEALARLTSLSLLDMDDPTAGPTIHPLLAEYARTLLAEPQEEKAFAPLPALAKALVPLAAEANETGLPARFAPLRPHVEAVAPAAEAAQLEEGGTLWNALGWHLQDVADYPGARAAYQRALAIGEAAYGPDHPKVAIRVNNLGGVLHDLGEYEEARAAYQRALAIDEAAFGPDHPNVARDVNNLGSVLQDLGEYEGARVAYQRALAIDEAAFGPDHPEVAIDVNNLGLVLKDLGEYEEARAAYQRALAIDEAAFGPDHPEVAIDVNNLGGVLKDLGEYEEARAAYQRALAIDEAAFGANHPNVAISVNNLGSVLQALGEYEGARAAYQRALAIDEAAFGPDHPNVAIDVNNLGLVLQDLGEYEGARAAYQRALAIFEQHLGPDHPNVATLVNNLGMVLRALGEYAGARAAYQRALAIWESAYGESHPQVATANNNLSYVLEELGDLHGAHAAAARAYTILEASLPSEHPNVHSARRHLEALRQQIDQQ